MGMVLAVSFGDSDWDFFVPVLLFYFETLAIKVTYKIMEEKFLKILSFK